jgi:YggT family protein
MSAIIDFLYVVIQYLLSAIVWLVIASAIASWLIAFDVINMRNRGAYNVIRFLDRVTAPLLRPFRRIIPSLGGVDITPMILIIIILAAQRTLLPPLHDWLVAMVGGGAAVS